MNLPAAMDFWFHSTVVVKDTWNDISLIRFTDLFCDLIANLEDVPESTWEDSVSTVIGQDVLHVSLKPIWLEYWSSPVSRESDSLAWMTCPLLKVGTGVLCSAQLSVSPFILSVLASHTHVPEAWVHMCCDCYFLCVINCALLPARVRF